MRYLFRHGREAYRPLATGGANRPKQYTAKIDKADSAMVAIFMELQNVWRRQGTLRRTYSGMPSSREERRAWKQLILHLEKLPPQLPD